MCISAFVYICQVTSAESTPVDRLLGFFFLWTAVRPVVGEPGVSLSPRSWLAYEHWATLDYHKKYKIFDSLPFARAPLCRNSIGPTKIGIWAFRHIVQSWHGAWHWIKSLHYIDSWSIVKWYEWFSTPNPEDVHYMPEWEGTFLSSRSVCKRECEGTFVIKMQWILGGLEPLQA